MMIVLFIFIYLVCVEVAGEGRGKETDFSHNTQLAQHCAWIGVSREALNWSRETLNDAQPTATQKVKPTTIDDA